MASQFQSTVSKGFFFSNHSIKKKHQGACNKDPSGFTGTAGRSFLWDSNSVPRAISQRPFQVTPADLSTCESSLSADVSPGCVAPPALLFLPPSKPGFCSCKGKGQSAGPGAQRLTGGAAPVHRTGLSLLLLCLAPCRAGATSTVPDCVSSCRIIPLPFPAFSLSVAVQSDSSLLARVLRRHLGMTGVSPWVRSSLMSNLIKFQTTLGMVAKWSKLRLSFPLPQGPVARPLLRYQILWCSSYQVTSSSEVQGNRQ